MAGEFTVGDMTAFNTYVSMLIFPMIMLGFVSNIIARAVTSYQRIEEVLNFEGKDDFGDIDKEIKGKIEFKLDKTGNINAAIGKISFTEEQLEDNINAFLKALEDHKPTGVKGKLIRKIYIAPTMGPGIKIEC